MSQLFNYDKSKYDGILIAYARFSSKRQGKEGKSSYSRQINAAMDFAERHNLYYSDDLVFADLGRSGYSEREIPLTFKDGGMKDLLDFLKFVPKEHRSEVYVGFHNFDRFSRMKETLALSQFSAILEAGFKIAITMQDKIYSQDFQLNDLLICLVHMHLAYEESRKKSAYVKNALSNRFEFMELAYNSDLNKEFGYKHVGYSAHNPRWINSEKTKLLLRREKHLQGMDTPIIEEFTIPANRFTLDPEKVEVIKYVFYMLDQGVGSTTIANRLNEQDVEPFSGSAGQYRKAKYWDKSFVLRLLESDALIGKKQFCATETEEYVNSNGDISNRKISVPKTGVLNDYYPRIFSDEYFYQVRDKVRLKASSQGRKGIVFRNLFNGVARCAHCGDTFHYTRSTKKNGQHNAYTFCSRARRTDECNGRGVRYDVMETNFLRMVNHIDYDKVFMQLNHKSNTYQSEINSIKNDIAHTEQQLEFFSKNLTKLALAGIELSDSDLQERINLDKKIAVLKEKLEELEPKYQAFDAQSKILKLDFSTITEKLADSLLTDEELYDVRAKFNQFLHRNILFFNVISTLSIKYGIVVFTDNIIRTFPLTKKPVKLEGFDPYKQLNFMVKFRDDLSIESNENILLHVLKATENIILEKVSEIETVDDSIQYLDYIYNQTLNSIT
ncbi:recombinase family protein [Vibrio aestuarianus]|uniref:recombinase family protein n=1 Tax=Vibrio aestuarianus TaxID=28171 RepID=UPI00237CEB97|nr:recombinase family protein [Vibrio aestuarianus]MDE1236588.1 recombinase family protein [Vibrio aestuarianus]MDE1247467.1 recombinase family protein [Vibrio aestuarianus]